MYYVEKNMINFKYTVISGLPQDVSARIKYLILLPFRRKGKFTVLAVSVRLSALNKYFRHNFLIIDFYFPWAEHFCELFSLDHPDLPSLDERLD